MVSVDVLVGVVVLYIVQVMRGVKGGRAPFSEK